MIMIREVCGRYLIPMAGGIFDRSGGVRKKKKGRGKGMRKEGKRTYLNKETKFY